MNYGMLPTTFGGGIYIGILTGICTPISSYSCCRHNHFEDHQAELEEDIPLHSIANCHYRSCFLSFDRFVFYCCCFVFVQDHQHA